MSESKAIEAFDYAIESADTELIVNVVLVPVVVRVIKLKKV